MQSTHSRFLPARLAPALVAGLLLLGASGCRDQAAPESGAAAAEQARVVVYTSRQPHLVTPLFERFTAETGIEVDYTSDSDAALIERLAAEGERTPADVLITVDAGNLWQAAQRELLQPLDSDVLRRRVPAALRDPQGRWFGLSVRARTIVYHADRVDPSELSTYADLADPRWSGRLCLRTSQKVYNQSLVAMLLEDHGTERTEEIVSGWVANLATTPHASDTRLIEAMAAGQCDVGVVNTYYLGRLQAEDPDYPVRLFWANQDSTGVHVNVSGAGLTRHAPRPERGRELLEWMTSSGAQELLAGSNLEFPVADGVALDPVVAAWGEYRGDETNLAVAGRRQAEAVRLMDRAGWR